MTTITIPTTIFVKKIVFAQRRIPLTARTQNAAIQLCEDDELFDLLRYSGTLGKYAKAQKLLTETINFELSETIAKHVAKDVYAIGMYLDRFFKRELCKNVEARSKSDTEKTQSIRDFLSFADIEEDDYSREAAVKRVQRHISQKKVSFLEIRPVSNVGSKFPKMTSISHYTDAELEICFQNYLRQYPIYFYTRRRKLRTALPDQCRAWIWQHIGKRPPQYIAQKFVVTPCAVWKRVNAFQNEFQHRPKPTPCSILPKSERA